MEPVVVNFIAKLGNPNLRNNWKFGADEIVTAVEKSGKYVSTFLRSRLKLGYIRPYNNNELFSYHTCMEEGRR